MSKEKFLDKNDAIRCEGGGCKFLEEIDGKGRCKHVANTEQEFGLINGCDLFDGTSQLPIERTSVIKIIPEQRVSNCIMCPRIINDPNIGYCCTDADNGFSLDGSVNFENEVHPNCPLNDAPIEKRVTESEFKKVFDERVLPLCKLAELTDQEIKEMFDEVYKTYLKVTFNVKNVSKQLSSLIAILLAKNEEPV